MGFKFLEDIAKADIAFEAEEKELDKLFETCAKAVFEVMVETSKVEPKIKKEIKLENKDSGDLLFDFLSTLVAMKDSDYIVFSKFEVDINKNKLKAIIYGNSIDKVKKYLRTDVKAITLHMFELKQEKGKWKARIVLDV